MPPSLAAIIIKNGHQAVHVRNVNLKGKPDEAIFAHAETNDQIIITHDLDFSRIHAYSGKNKPSVILFRIEPLITERIAELLLSHLNQLESDLAKGAFVVIENVQIRIRELPIKTL